MQYAELRSQIKTGDAILWKSRGVIPWLIQRFSAFSHASLVVRLDRYEEFTDRIFLVEALAAGVQLRLLSERLKNHRGETFWFKPIGLSHSARTRIGTSALDVCARGIPYDYGSLFRNMLGRVSLNARRYFCSEFIWDMWRKAPFFQAVMGPVTAPRPGDIPVWIKGQLTRIDKEA